jgi:transcription antitermination factor NusB
MPSRRKSRRHALQILFQLDLTPQPVEQAIRAFYDSLYPELEPTRPEPDPFAEKLVRGVQERRKEIDELIERHAHNWRLERMPVVDRNVMRLAIFEMMGTADRACDRDQRSSGAGAQVLRRGIGPFHQRRAGRRSAGTGRERRDRARKESHHGTLPEDGLS